MGDAAALCLPLLLILAGHGATARGTGVTEDTTMEDLPWSMIGQELRRYMVSLTNLASNSSQIHPDDISENCRRDLNQTIMDVFRGEHYALQMLDASAKIPSGISEGMLKFPGAYDTCLKVVPIENKTTFGGRYCTASFDIKKLVPGLNASGSATSLIDGLVASVSACVPDSCDDNSVIQMINKALGAMTPSPSLTIDSVECDLPKPLKIGDIVALTVIGLLVFLVLLGTSFDILYRCCRTWNLRGPPDMMGDPLEGEEETKPLLYDQEGDPVASTSYSYSSRSSHASGSSGSDEFSRPKLGLFWRVLLCFSAVTNGEKILRTDAGEENIAVLHGVRVLSIWWVILGHTVLYIVLYTDNILTVVDMSKRFTFLAISNGTFSVDSFLFLSGLLVCYLTMRKLDDHDGSINWGLFYFHRIFRLTPALGFVIMFYTTILPHLPEVPKGPGIAEGKCGEYWWTSLIYINNIYPLRFSDICMQWTWYLSCDFQFYVLSPVFIILLYFKPRLGILVACVVGFLSVLASLIMSEFFALPSFATMFYIEKPAKVSRLLYPVEGFDYIYSKPYTRIPAYLVGMLMGVVLHSTKCRTTYRFKKISVLLCWLTSAALALTVVYGFYGNIHNGVAVSTELAAFYNGVARLVWCLSLSWVVFACIHGVGGPVDMILTWRFWKPLSHLTYCVYLVHPIWMMIYTNYLRRQVHFDDLNLIYLFCGNLVMSYLIAFCVSLLVESPLIALEKIIFASKRKKRGVWDFATDREGFY